MLVKSYSHYSVATCSFFIKVKRWHLAKREMTEVKMLTLLNYWDNMVISQGIWWQNKNFKVFLGVLSYREMMKCVNCQTKPHMHFTEEDSFSKDSFLAVASFDLCFIIFKEVAGCKSWKHASNTWPSFCSFLHELSLEASTIVLCTVMTRTFWHFPNKLLISALRDVKSYVTAII